MEPLPCAGTTAHPHGTAKTHRIIGPRPRPPQAALQLPPQLQNAGLSICIWPVFPLFHNQYTE